MLNELPTGFILPICSQGNGLEDVVVVSLRLASRQLHPLTHSP